MTATPSRPEPPVTAPNAVAGPRRAPGGRPPEPRRARAGEGTRTLLWLPVLTALVLPASFTGGGTRRWFGGRAESQRARAQAAKDEAADAFYELDSAQRDLRISVETVSAVDDSPAAARVVEAFAALGGRIDQASRHYIAAVDAHDLDRDDLETAAASRARAEFAAARDELTAVRAELDRFAEELEPLLGDAQTRLARLAPTVEGARRSLTAASEALDHARAAGLGADDLAARLAALGPELTRLNEGAARHGLAETLERARRVGREAEAVRAEAERLPRRAAEIGTRLISLRTRAQALGNRTEQVAPVLSELRRRFAASCWQDLQRVPEQATETLGRAERRLAEAETARDEGRWPDATALVSTVRALLDSTDEAVSSAGERLRQLDAVQKDPDREVERTRFAVRDAQRLAMAGRHTADPRHARPLDEAVARLERARTSLRGRHPDYWRFLTETAEVREIAARVVAGIREERGGGSGPAGTR
ncbi:hypothetical protein AAH978_02550 [Streptomyces sp. ZYX-F-203]